MLNQNQSWNLSLEGAWNSTTVNGTTENRTFNQVYEILTSNSNPLTHDRKGNLTQNKDSSQYTWDYNNQLSHAINASSENASYTYDALGRRISKQVSGITTVYVNVGYQIATEYQSTDGINFSEKQSYVYATYIDDPLVLVKASGERFYYHSNGQFSISKITDEYKNVVEAYAYNAYGDVQILQSYPGLDNPYYFTGRQLDPETNLFYFRARYYDAKLGQFISRDPIGYVDGFSLYRGYFAVNGLDAEGKKVSLMEDGGVEDLSDIPFSDYSVRQESLFRQHQMPSGVTVFTEFEDALDIQCKNGELNISGTNSVSIILFSNYTTINNFSVLEHEDLHRRNAIWSWNSLASNLNALELVQNQYKCCCAEARRYAMSLALYFKYENAYLDAQVHTVLYGDGGVQSMSNNKEFYEGVLNTAKHFKMLENIYGKIRDEMYGKFLDCIGRN